MTFSSSRYQDNKESKVISIPLDYSRKKKNKKKKIESDHVATYHDSYHIPISAASSKSVYHYPTLEQIYTTLQDQYSYIPSCLDRKCQNCSGLVRMYTDENKFDVGTVYTLDCNCECHSNENLGGRYFASSLASLEKINHAEEKVCKERLKRIKKKDTKDSLYRAVKTVMDGGAL